MGKLLKLIEENKVLKKMLKKLRKEQLEKNLKKNSIRAEQGGQGGNTEQISIQAEQAEQDGNTKQIISEESTLTLIKGNEVEDYEIEDLDIESIATQSKAATDQGQIEKGKKEESGDIEVSFESDKAPVLILNTPRRNLEEALFGQDTQNTAIEEKAKVECVDGAVGGGSQRSPSILFSRRKERVEKRGDTVKSTEGDNDKEQGDVRASSPSSDSDSGEQPALPQGYDLLSAASRRKIEFVDPELYKYNDSILSNTVNETNDGNDVHVRKLEGSPSPTPSYPHREDQQLLGKERDQGKGV